MRLAYSDRVAVPHTPKEIAAMLRPPDDNDLAKFSPAQRRVIGTDGITFLGMDAANRPVVEGMVGIPNQLRRWAVTRAGDPFDIKDN